MFSKEFKKFVQSICDALQEEGFPKDVVEEKFTCESVYGIMQTALFGDKKLGVLKKDTVHKAVCDALIDNSGILTERGEHGVASTREDLITAVSNNAVRDTRLLQLLADAKRVKAPSKDGSPDRTPPKPKGDDGKGSGGVAEEEEEAAIWF